MIRRPALRIAALTVVRSALDAAAIAVGTIGNGCTSALATIREELTRTMREAVHELGASCECPACTARREAAKQATSSKAAN